MLRENILNCCSWDGSSCDFCSYLFILTSVLKNVAGDSAVSIDWPRILNWSESRRCAETAKLLVSHVVKSSLLLLATRNLTLKHILKPQSFNFVSSECNSMHVVITCCIIQYSNFGQLSLDLKTSNSKTRLRAIKLVDLELYMSAWHNSWPPPSTLKGPKSTKSVKWKNLLSWPKHTIIIVGLSFALLKIWKTNSLHSQNCVWQSLVHPIIYQSNS